ncbi:MAG: hypothetical protein KDC38_04350 [Planctomycetes bacterium]|nr:hypothetical protein [Planctomycetota bacterium]
MIARTQTTPEREPATLERALPRLHQDLCRGSELGDRDETRALRLKLLKRVLRNPERVAELFDGLDADLPAIRYGCSSLLRAVSEEKPELLADHWKQLITRLSDDSEFLRWDAMAAISNLAGVVNKRRVDSVLDRLLEPIQGPTLAAAANAINGAARIAQLQPKCATKVVDGLLQVGKSKFEAPDEKNVAIGQAITALAVAYESVDDKSKVLRFVRRQRENVRPETQAKAERFLERHEQMKKAGAKKA